MRYRDTGLEGASSLKSILLQEEDYSTLDQFCWFKLYPLRLERGEIQVTKVTKDLTEDSKASLALPKYLEP